MWPWKKKQISDYDRPVPREVLIQGARIAIIDDDDPLIIDELRRTGFAVDHDKTGIDLRAYDQQLYDVVIIDFHGVGAQLGPQQGLELVRHIRRVSPRSRVMAYTSRSLAPSESEFYTLSHTVLPKDLGLRESMTQIEGEVRKAFSKQFLFDALIEKLQGVSSDKRSDIERQLVKALGDNEPESFKKIISKAAGFGAEKAVDVIIAKLFA